MAWSWAQLPLDRVIRLSGASNETIGLALDPLPADSPAVVMYRPSAAPSPQAAITRLLDELDAVATNLYPAWLPSAAAIEGRASTDVAAVRALARRSAATAADFGPFMSDLAERALLKRSTRARALADSDSRDDQLDRDDRVDRVDRAAPPEADHVRQANQRRTRGRFVAEVRAAGLVRVVATSYQRSRTALLVDLPEELSTDAQRSLLTAFEWFVYHGRAGAWLTGAAPDDLDRIATVPVRLAGGTDDESSPFAHGPSVGAEAAGELPPRMTFPALAGRPHPASDAEQALENALTAQAWALGRSWNLPYSFGALTNPVKLDLVWLSERCVIEVDGPEHRGKAHYENDRRRDVDLQLDGFAVLRFTNDQIFHDVDAVVARIGEFIQMRRQRQQEGHPHA